MAASQKSRIISLLKNRIPFRPQARALKRALFPYRSNPANDMALLFQSLRMVAALSEAGIDIRGSTVVEIGTGWIPVLPLVFRAAGVREIVSVDQERLMDGHTFIHAVSVIRTHIERVVGDGAARSLFDLALLPKEQKNTLFELCRSAGITYRAPADFMDLQPNSADLIVSRTVLEHIPADLLRKLLDHAKVILKPGGKMCHLIDMSDHFEHVDKSLSCIDMLRYDEVQWQRRTRDPQDFQNRLRRFEFVNLFTATGWEIIKMTGKPDSQAMKDLKGMRIVSKYANTPHEELAILRSLIIARPVSQ